MSTLPMRSHWRLLSSRLAEPMVALPVAAVAAAVVGLEPAETHSTKASLEGDRSEHTAGRRHGTTNRVCRKTDTASSLYPGSSG